MGGGEIGSASDPFVLNRKSGIEGKKKNLCILCRKEIVAKVIAGVVYFY